MYKKIYKHFIYELLMNFKLFLNIMVEILHKEIQSLHNFSFLKIVNIEPANKFKVFFERDALSAHKTSLVISFTSLTKME